MDPLVVGLFGGLVGSLIGAALAVMTAWTQRRRKEQGAARAIHFEMTLNSTYLEALAERDESWGEISSQIFLSQIATLAPALDGPSFRKVSIAYVTSQHAEQLRRGAVERGYALSTEDRKLLLGVAEDFDVGARVLRDRYWKDDVGSGASK